MSVLLSVTMRNLRMTMKINKQLLLFLMFFYFFLFYDVWQQKIYIIKYADDVIALTAVPVFLFQLSKNHFKLRVNSPKMNYAIYFALLLVLGSMSSVIFRYQPLIAVLSDIFLVTKFWLAIYVGKHFLPNILCKNNAKDIFFHIKLITWFYATAVFADHLLGGIFPAEIRYGLRAMQLFYGHPTYFAGSCVLIIVILLSIRDWINGFEKYFMLLLALLCCTLRSKAIGGAIVFAAIYYFIYIRKKKVNLKTIFLLAVIVVVVCWPQILFYFFSSRRDDYARYQLVAKSILIANDHFPFGAGFATFASLPSATSYSPLYKMYGISNVFGLNKGGGYISDTFFPMILGQFGWIGLVLFGMAVFKLYQCIQKMRTGCTAFYASGLGILFYLLLSSIAEAAFVSWMAIPWALWLGVLFQTYEAQNKSKVAVETEKISYIDPHI